LENAELQSAVRFNSIGNDSAPDGGGFPSKRGRRICVSQPPCGRSEFRHCAAGYCVAGAAGHLERRASAQTFSDNMTGAGLGSARDFAARTSGGQRLSS